jgi:hypothetical protein
VRSVRISPDWLHSCSKISAGWAAIKDDDCCGNAECCLNCYQSPGLVHESGLTYRHCCMRLARSEERKLIAVQCVEGVISLDLSISALEAAANVAALHKSRSRTQCAKNMGGQIRAALV